jgi:DUF971 family protein
MKILVEYNENESGFEQLKIDSAKYLSDYAIRIKFSDGHEKLVDFKPFLIQVNAPIDKKISR